MSDLESLSIWRVLHVDNCFCKMVDIVKSKWHNHDFTMCFSLTLISVVGGMSFGWFVTDNGFFHLFCKSECIRKDWGSTVFFMKYTVGENS